MRAGIAAWNERGIDGFVERLAPDVVWHSPDYIEGTEWHGREVLLDAWRLQFDSVFEDVRVELEEFEEGSGGSLTAVRCRGRARGTGMELKWHSYFVTSIEGDLITDLYVYNQREDARRAAGLDAE
jgi:ketosteroid isomerase-like protein